MLERLRFVTPTVQHRGEPLSGAADSIIGTATAHIPPPMTAPVLAILKSALRRYAQMPIRGCVVSVACSWLDGVYIYRVTASFAVGERRDRGLG
jgi:hypothetical protein